MIDQKALLDLANVFLQSPKGKDLVAKAEAAKAQASGALPPGVTVEDVKNRVKKRGEMKKPTSIVPVDTNFGSVINTKSMEMNDPLHPSAHIGRVSPSPFLFTRIQAKVDAMKDVPQQMGWVSWTSIAVGLVLILFIEVHAVRSGFSSEKVDITKNFSSPTEQLY